MHLEQDIEAPAVQSLHQVFQALQSGLLVEGDQLDAVKAFHQLRFALAENPGDFSSREVLLKGVDQRQDMRSVAERR